MNKSPKQHARDEYCNENYNDTIEIKRYEYQNMKDELEFLRGCVKENAIESTKICKTSAEYLKILKDAEAEYINIEAIKQENKDLKYLVEQYKFLVEQLNTPIIVSAAPVTTKVID